MERTKLTWRERATAFFDGAAGIGDGMSRIGEGMSRIGLLPERPKPLTDEEARALDDAKFWEDSAKVLGDMGLKGSDEEATQ